MTPATRAVLAFLQSLDADRAAALTRTYADKYAPVRVVAGGGIAVSQPVIAAETGVSIPSIHRAMDRLEADGAVAVRREHGAANVIHIAP